MYNILCIILNILSIFGNILLSLILLYEWLHYLQCSQFWNNNAGLEPYLSFFYCSLLNFLSMFNMFKYWNLKFMKNLMKFHISCIIQMLICLILLLLLLNSIFRNIAFCYIWLSHYNCTHFVVVIVVHYNIHDIKNI